MIDKRWVVKPTPADDRVNRLSNAINISKPIARILCQRGIDSYDRAKEFFNPSLDQLIDPLLMKDMDKAVSRIDEAIREEENILVYGDYDVDGTTSVALFFRVLELFFMSTVIFISRTATKKGMEYHNRELIGLYSKVSHLSLR